MSAQKIVDEMLEADEFSARQYFEKTPDELFDEGLGPLLKHARGLHAKLMQQNVIKVASEGQQHLDQSAITKAVIRLALEKQEAPIDRRMYLRIKRYGRFLI